MNDSLRRVAVGNELLAALSPRDHERPASRMQAVVLERRQTIDGRRDCSHFLAGGLASRVPATAVCLRDGQ